MRTNKRKWETIIKMPAVGENLNKYINMLKPRNVVSRIRPHISPWQDQYVTVYWHMVLVSESIHTNVSKMKEKMNAQWRKRRRKEEEDKGGRRKRKEEEEGVRRRKKKRRWRKRKKKEQDERVVEEEEAYKAGKWWWMIVEAMSATNDRSGSVGWQKLECHSMLLVRRVLANGLAYASPNWRFKFFLFF